MFGYPDYLGFRVKKIDFTCASRRRAFVREEVRRFYRSDMRLERRLANRLRGKMTVLSAQRGDLEIVVAASAPMDAYDMLLDQIDELLNPRALRQVESLN